MQLFPLGIAGLFRILGRHLHAVEHLARLLPDLGVLADLGETREDGQVDIRLHLLRAVALMAVLRQQRQNVGLVRVRQRRHRSVIRPREGWRDRHQRQQQEV